jgi:hypothetical protein
MIPAPDLVTIARAVALLSDPAARLHEARWCSSERRKPERFVGLPEALGRALDASRAEARREALRLEGEALWAAAERCQRGWAEHVGWQRLERELTAEERSRVCVSGRKGRRMRTAWVEAKRAKRPAPASLRPRPAD